MQAIVQHEKLSHIPMILETPWIGKNDKTQRPMYEAEIALLRGDTEARFGIEFLDHVERLDHFFAKQAIDHRDFILNTWDMLKNDDKAKKADKREPMERLFDIIEAEGLFKDLNEEQINQRLTAWLAGKQV
jgi:deoxyribonuclease-4